MGNTMKTDGNLDERLFRREGVAPVLACADEPSARAGVVRRRHYAAMMIATTCNFTSEQEAAIIQVSLILSAIDTLLH